MTGRPRAPSTSPPAATLAGLLLSSSAALICELALTRVLSVIQWYHFAFLVVALAMLGFGVSGTILAAIRPLAAPSAARLLTLLGIGQAASAVGAVAVLNLLPLDLLRLAS